MAEPSHDLLSVVGELSAKLASRSRHICILLGAGASVGAGLPHMQRLTEIVHEKLEGRNKELFEELIRTRNLEQALTRLRRIESLLEGEETIGGIDKVTAKQADQKICAAIIGAIREPKTVDAFARFGSWANSVDYVRPLEVFTTNYDLLIETGLEHVGASYFDGFVGTINGYFRPDLVENGDGSKQVPASFVRLWKLHGSSNWAWQASGTHRRIVRLGSHASEDRAVAIYPSDEKYDDSRRVPFVVLMDRFRRALTEPETLLIVNGYSFSDQHLNEMIFEAATRMPRSEFVALCYSNIPDVLIGQAARIKNLTVLGAEQALIGGRLGSWACKEEVSGIAENGRCRLGDFACLTNFLDWRNKTAPTVSPA